MNHSSVFGWILESMRHLQNLPWEIPRDRSIPLVLRFQQRSVIKDLPTTGGLQRMIQWILRLIALYVIRNWENIADTLLDSVILVAFPSKRWRIWRRDEDPQPLQSCLVASTPPKRIWSVKGIFRLLMVFHLQRMRQSWKLSISRSCSTRIMKSGKGQHNERRFQSLVQWDWSMENWFLNEWRWEQISQKILQVNPSEPSQKWWRSRECKNVSVNWKSATSFKEPPLGVTERGEA